MASTPDALRYNRQHHGMRKDQECAYGRTKKRWRALHYPIRFRSSFQVEHLLKFACALQNALHDTDSLGDNWTAFNVYRQEINEDFIGVKAPPLDEESEEVEAEPESDLTGVPEPPSLTQLIEELRSRSVSILRKQLTTHYAEAKVRGWVGWPTMMRPSEF